MFSFQVSVVLQLGQRDRRGLDTVSPSSGRRWMATFRNEPTNSPSTDQYAIAASGGNDNQLNAAPPVASVPR